MGRLTIERNGAITRVSLRRCDAHQASHVDLLSELLEALHEIDRDGECAAAIFAGIGKAFSRDDEGEESSFLFPATAGDEAKLFQDVVQSLNGLNAVTIGHANGDEEGIAERLILACDIVIAAEASSSGAPKISWAVAPGEEGKKKLAKLADQLPELEPELLGSLVNAG